MKFSEQKKQKMRTARYKRNKKTYSSAIGCQVIPNTEVLDIMNKRPNVYFLVYNYYTEKYCISKAVSPHEVVMISARNVLVDKETFENAEKWKKNTKVTINEKGEITAIKRKTQSLYGLTIFVDVGL